MHRIVDGGKGEVAEKRLAITSILANRVHQEICIAHTRVEISWQAVEKLPVHGVSGRIVSRENPTHVVPVGGTSDQHGIATLKPTVERQ